MPQSTGRLAFSLLAGTSLIAVSPAYAQDTQEDEGQPVITVTALKREQNLQDVPIVVTSLPEAALENAGVKDIKDMTILTPGLTVTSTSNESSIRCFRRLLPSSSARATRSPHG